VSMKSFFVLIALMIFCFSCAPIISDEVYLKVDKDISLKELFKTPEKFVGQTVLIGGVVIQFDSSNNRLLAFQTELDQRLQPLVNDETLGRFLIAFDKPIDGDKFEKGVKLTLVGTLEGTEKLPLHQTFYNYLILKPIEYHVWSKDQPWDFRPGFQIGVGLSGSI
jgi:starvation-inducible outer membrane lipoprotein